MAAPKGNKNAKGNGGGGRKSSYTPELCEWAEKLAKLGATDKEIGDSFGVSESTINRWKLEHVEFLESLKKGKIFADANVAQALYHRACGYSHEDVHISNFQGEITLTPIVKHYPPDTAAAFIWLKNRQSKYWRDKVDETSSSVDLVSALNRVADKLPD